MNIEEPNPLRGRRILVVEDEMLVALALEDLLVKHEAEVLGPLATVPKVLNFLQSDRPDCVTLDMNLKGELSVPIAENLISRAIPFVIVSGYVRRFSALPQLQTAPFVRKPFSHDVLISVLHSVLA